MITNPFPLSTVSLNIPRNHLDPQLWAPFLSFFLVIGGSSPTKNSHNHHQKMHFSSLSLGIQPLFISIKPILSIFISMKAPRIATGWWFGCHFWHFPINIGLLSSSQLTNSNFMGRLDPDVGTADGGLPGWSDPGRLNGCWENDEFIHWELIESLFL